MTLFEAVRELKEGQAICGPLDSDERPIIAWHWCNSQPAGTFSRNMKIELECGDCRIIDLPKPKMTLEEGLEKAAFECLIGKRFDNSLPTGYRWTANGIEYPTWQQAVAAAFASALRSLPIGWQAEADRKEAE